MTLRVKICLGIFGVMIGILTVFAMDMLFNNGRMVAHSLHDRNPTCSAGCHGAVPAHATLYLRTYPPPAVVTAR